jgi:hypothetical protein
MAPATKTPIMMSAVALISVATPIFHRTSAASVVTSAFQGDLSAAAGIGPVRLVRGMEKV